MLRFGEKERLYASEPFQGSSASTITTAAAPRDLSSATPASRVRVRGLVIPLGVSRILESFAHPGASLLQGLRGRFLAPTRRT